MQSIIINQEVSKCLFYWQRKMSSNDHIIHNTITGRKDSLLRNNMFGKSIVDPYHTLVIFFRFVLVMRIIFCFHINSQLFWCWHKSTRICFWASSAQIRFILFFWLINSRTLALLAYGKTDCQI